MDPQDLWSWDRARRFLPFDLDGLARETGLLRRLRGTDDAEGLARILLLLAVPGASLRTASAWGRESGLARMGACALFLRLRDAEGFLERCFREALRHAGGATPRRFAGLRLVAVDATVPCGPGATGTDLRLHTVCDLGSGTARSAELAGPEGGERLSRHASLGPGDLVLADRGYGHARGILSCLGAGARLLVRFEPATIRLADSAAGGRLGPEEAERLLPARGGADLAVRLPGSDVPCAPWARAAPGAGRSGSSPTSGPRSCAPRRPAPSTPSAGRSSCSSSDSRASPGWTASPPATAPPPGPASGPS